MRSLGILSLQGEVVQQKHYPDGYRMEFVPSDEIKTHELLQKAFKLNQEQGEKECPTPEK